MSMKSPVFFDSNDYIDLAFFRMQETSYPESYLKVYLKDNNVSKTTTSRPRITRGEQFTGTTPKPKPKPKLDTYRQSGVIFNSGLIRASGDSINVREFCKARGLAPTLHLVIPSASDSVTPPTTTDGATHVEQKTSSPFPNGRESARRPLPSFSLTIPSPNKSLPSPVLYPASIQRTFTRFSYFYEASRAPRHMRIPHLPQYCAHTLQPFVPLTKCTLCEIQILACETWWNSRNPKHHAGLKRLLCAPQVLPADCTPTTRSIYYALGLPLGELDESCIDWDVVDVIMFMPSCPPRRLLGRRQPRAMVRYELSSSSTLRSRIRVLFRRARRFFSIL